MRLAVAPLAGLAPADIWRETLAALSGPRPQRLFQVLRACGRLEHLFPDLHRLFGVPQPARHHPEVDTGAHLFLCLEQAARLSPDPAVRFAVLVHDLGKGTTPPEIWPHHYAHEERSAQLLEAWCARYPVPAAYCALARRVARYHGRCHRVRELNPRTVLKTLYALEAFDEPEQFARFVLACEADARGRLGLEDQPYPQAACFRAAYHAAAALVLDDLPPEIAPQRRAEALYRLRLRLRALRGALQASRASAR